MSELLGFAPVWILCLCLLAAVGFWLLVTGIINVFRGRLLRGPLRSAVGLALGAMSVALAAIGINLHTYHRLNYESPVAWLEFEQVGARHYQALLKTANGDERAFGVHGDEWQLDARVLKWKGAGALLGLDPRYRLERLSGRYASSTDEQHARRSIYGLHEREQGIDIWKVSQKLDAWVPLVDTVYGSAAYMPMHDNARFVVVITEDGLVARRESPNAAPR